MLTAKEILITPENDTVEEMQTKKGKKQKPRSFQVSMPEHYHTYLKILALVGGTNVSELLRSLAEPYLEYAKEILVERGYTNEWKQVVVNTEDILEELKPEIRKNPEKFLKDMTEYGKKHNLNFSFVNIDKMF